MASGSFLHGFPPGILVQSHMLPVVQCNVEFSQTGLDVVFKVFLLPTMGSFSSEYRICLERCVRHANDMVHPSELMLYYDYAKHVNFLKKRILAYHSG